MNRIQTLDCFQHIQWHPSARDLRMFALVMLAGWFLIGGLAAVHSGGITAGTIQAWSAGVALALAGLTPGLGRWTYVAVYMVSGVAGWIVSHVLLVVLFYLVFTPIGLLMRITGGDPLQLRSGCAARIWRESREPGEAANYYRQF